MTDSILKTAFENIATHVSNLDSVRELIEDLDNQNESIDHIISMLERRSEEAEVTLRTDIRILINECLHLMRKMTN
ncbi:MAG: hypothetical protein ACFFCT_07335 [Candidatus Odinarchaeota archaeon]|nr:hypothetical protein [Candidatus Thorarchaeota archaeon]